MNERHVQASKAVKELLAALISCDKAGLSFTRLPDYEQSPVFMVAVDGAEYQKLLIPDLATDRGRKLVETIIGIVNKRLLKNHESGNT